jgi:hypothetical protein
MQDFQVHQREIELKESPQKLQPPQELQFDEMETFEHTKCKPLSIALVVEAKSRKILGVSVARMPASGPLAEISRRKYGLRKDERSQKAHALLQSLAPTNLPSTALLIRTDQNPKYPHWIKRSFPKAQHVAHLGKRGCITGQGELKKVVFDPLFSLNHTAAMIRANVSRLARKTWCTTKKPEKLLARLHIYLRYHNTVLLPLAGT